MTSSKPLGDDVKEVNCGIENVEPFNMNGAVALVTGGGSGIGFGIVEQLIKNGCAKIIITGRTEETLKKAQSKYSDKIDYLVSDAGSPADRAKLFEQINSRYQNLNVLVNNAGIQRRVSLAEDNAPWSERVTELEINLNGPVHLCSLFIPLLLKQTKPAAIINVTSGLAFVPFPSGPVYSATKAALHSFTMSLRYSLEKTHVRVVELAPPAVKTNLGGSHSFGEDCDEYCENAISRFVSGEREIGFRMSDAARVAGREQLAQMMKNIAQHVGSVQFSAPH